MLTESIVNIQQLEGGLPSFFSQYIGFHYDATNAANAEFYRLCDHLNWKRDDDERVLAYKDFQDALTRQFNANYGTDAEDLNAWQNLCIRLNIDPVPSSLKRCRQVRLLFRPDFDLVYDLLLIIHRTGCHRHPCEPC